MPQAFTKTQLTTKSESLAKVASKFKAAQEGGTLGPEEVKEIAEETISVLQDAAEMMSDVAEGVPAEESSPIEEGPVAAPEEEEPPVVATEGEDDDEEKKRLMDRIGSLESTIKGMKEASAREKIATEYAALWPTKQAKGKFASVMKSKDSIEILQAKLAEAKSIMSNQKIASLPRNSSYSLYDSFTNDESNERHASETQRKLTDSNALSMVI